MSVKDDIPTVFLFKANSKNVEYIDVNEILTSNKNYTK